MSISPSKSFLRLVMDEENPAPCTKEDPELFHPVSYQGGNDLQIKQAKAVCKVCPITTRLACLEYAMETGDQYGIFGATTPLERDDIRRKRAERAQRRTERLAA
jgi:WhiB family redox-sensing transcriptional regulator